MNWQILSWMGRGAPALLGLLVFDHSITLFPFKYLSTPILSLFLPLMVMPKVVLINSGQKLCFFAHLVLYLHNAIKHLVSRVLRDSIPSFVHPSVGRLVGPRFTFWHFCRHGWVNSLLSLRILLKSKIDVWAKYKYPISNINTSTHSIYVILGLIWLSWGQWRAEGKFWPRDSWFCLEKTYRCIFDLFWGLKKWSGWADLKLVEAGLVPGKADLEPWSS